VAYLPCPRHVPARLRRRTTRGDGETGRHVLGEPGLVVFQSQQVVAAARHDLPGDFLLAAHGVDRNQCPAQFQHGKQPGDGGDLVAFIPHGHLAQAQAVTARPGADQVQAGAVGASGTAYGLAVDGDMAEAQFTTDGVDPGGETALESVRVQRGEDAVEGVVRGDAMGQAQAQGAQPRFLGASEDDDIDPGIAGRQYSSQGDEENVSKQMVVTKGRVSGIGQIPEVMGKVQGDVGSGGHGSVSDEATGDTPVCYGRNLGETITTLRQSQKYA
jgi:hypothetical protein